MNAIPHLGIAPAVSASVVRGMSALPAAHAISAMPGMSLHAPRKLKLATVSLAGCFGCHMSLLDIDERLLQLLELVEFDRSPLTDIKQIGRCDIGLIEGGLCNAENVEVLRDFRAHCKTLVAVGACAINGGCGLVPARLPALG